MNTVEHGCPSHLGKNPNSLPWPKSYFSNLPQCPELTASMSHWFSSIPFPQLRPLHTQFPPSRWLFSLPVPWLTFPLTGLSLTMPPGRPFPDHHPVVLFCSPVSPTRGMAPVISLVCLLVFVCLPLQRGHPIVAGTTLAFLVVSLTLGMVPGMW